MYCLQSKSVHIIIVSVETIIITKFLHL